MTYIVYREINNNPSFSYHSLDNLNYNFLFQKKIIINQLYISIANLHFFRSKQLTRDYV